MWVIEIERENLPALPIFFPNFLPFSSNLLGTFPWDDEPDCDISRGMLL